MHAPSIHPAVRRAVRGLTACAVLLTVAAPGASAQSSRGFGAYGHAAAFVPDAPAPPKIFVASYGSDANAGTSVSPKRNFQAAHDAVAAGGEIVVLDTAGYGALTITKSVTVTVPPGVNGFITVGGSTSGVTINAASTDVVVLRGLIIEGGGLNAFGIAAQAAVGTVRVEDCTVRNFFTGILMAPTTSGHLIVHGCFVRDVGYGIGTASNTASTVVDGVVTDTTVDAAAYGALDADGSDGGAARLVGNHCVLTNSGQGIRAEPAGTAVLGMSVVSGDGTGASNNGGTLVSFGDNRFFFNGTNGAFNSTAAGL